MSSTEVARGALVAIAAAIVVAFAMAGAALTLGASTNNARALGAYGLIIYPTVAALAYLGGVALGRRVTRS